MVAALTGKMEAVTEAVFASAEQAGAAQAFPGEYYDFGWDDEPLVICLINWVMKLCAL